jgi:gas vesicle protein
MMLAPKSGKEMRAELSEKLNQGLEQGKAQIQGAAERMANSRAES